MKEYITSINIGSKTSRLRSNLVGYLKAQGEGDLANRITSSGSSIFKLSESDSLILMSILSDLVYQNTFFRR